MNGIRNRDRLLSSIAEQLKDHKFKHVKTGCIQVTLVADGDRYEFGLAWSLAALADGIFWDERGNWSGATEAIVETI